MRSIKELINPNILSLYNEQTNEIEYGMKKENNVYINQNEIPFNNLFSRYNNDSVLELNKLFGKTFNVSSSNVLSTNGSVEAIQLIFKTFCISQQDNVIKLTPSRTIYDKCAKINNIFVRNIELNSEFQPVVNNIINAINKRTKVCFITNPNNIVGADIRLDILEELLQKTDCIVVVDESYGYYDEHKSAIKLIDRCSNLVVINSMSRTWGYASLRIGCIVASKDIIDVVRVAQLPYTISDYCAQKATKILWDKYEKEKWKRVWLPERNRLMQAFTLLNSCEMIYATSSNYFLVKFKDSEKVYNYLLSKGIHTKFVNIYPHCTNCIRFSVGTKNENNYLLSVLR